MRFNQRSYSGPSFRPTPIAHYEKNSDLLMVATAWGEPDAASLVMNKIKEFMQMSEDPESTIVGGHHEGLVRIENRMRSGAMLANELLYKSENNQEYRAAVELAMLSISKNMLHWVQVGAPHILLATAKGLEPICYTPDWSWQMQQSVPLLGQALGLEKTCHLNCGSYRLSPGQKIVLISRSQLPSHLYAQSATDLESISRILVEDNSEAPFWAAVVES